MAELSLVTIKVVAKLCDVSTATIRRIHDRGQMPKAIRVGGAVRWNRCEIDQWILDGCPKNPKRMSKIKAAKLSRTNK